MLRHGLERQRRVRRSSRSPSGEHAEAARCWNTRSGASPRGADDRPRGAAMADYTVVRVADTPDLAEAVGMDPDHFEVRFLREALGLENFADHVPALRGRLEADARPPARRPGGGLLPGLRAGRGEARRRRRRAGAVDGRSRPARDGEGCAGRRGRGRPFVIVAAPQAGLRRRGVHPGLLDRLMERSSSARVRAACQPRPSVSKRPAARSSSPASSRTRPRARSANGSR